ncbi:MAG: CHRD domain-containing protein, partial [Ignavibacteria bacterium]
GEVRGQVFISEGFGLTTQITRTQEVPPTTTNARGTGSATGTDAGLIFYNTFDGLLSPPTAAHFHNAPIGVIGPVVKNLMNNIMGNSIVGAWKRTDASMPITNNFISEAYIQNIYINIHTAQYPSGEIRGQLRSGALPIIGIQVISTLTITPENSINPVNTTHCVDGLVRDQNGAALPGIRVDYTVTGANPMTGFAITDTAGIAQFCYTGTNSGRDTIIGMTVGIMDTVYNLFEAPLPVELSSFSASVNKKDVTLNWVSAGEVNNSGFEIERKLISSEEWSVAGFVQGNGTTVNPMSYTYTVKNLASGKYNFRLKQIDFNGNYEYFTLQSEIEVGIPVKFDVSQNYPNPFNPSTKIDFQLPQDGNVNLSVYDNSGRLVSSILNGFRTAGYYTINFNASDLSSGIYFYKIEYNNISRVLKMSVIK